jgi:hypothetical protein
MSLMGTENGDLAAEKSILLCPHDESNQTVSGLLHSDSSFIVVGPVPYVELQFGKKALFVLNRRD